jgi:DNA mismatch repair ATPase MutS
MASESLKVFPSLNGSSFSIVSSVETDATRQAYEKMLNTPLSNDEYADASATLVGFFALLIEIDQDLRLSNKADEL